MAQTIEETNNRRRIAAWDEAKTGFQEARRRRGNFDVPSEGTEYLKVISEARATLVKCVVPSIAVCSQTGKLGETRCYPEIQMFGEN